MKELSRDVKASSKADKHKDKEPKEPKEPKESKDTAASDVESVKRESMFQRTRSLRLFRTVSRPRKFTFPGR